MSDESLPIEGELLDLPASSGFAFFLECVRTIALVVMAVALVVIA